MGSLNLVRWSRSGLRISFDQQVYLIAAGPGGDSGRRGAVPDSPGGRPVAERVTHRGARSEPRPSN